MRDKKSTKKEVKRRTGKLSGDITVAEVLEAMEYVLFGKLDDAFIVTLNATILC